MTNIDVIEDQFIFVSSNSLPVLEASTTPIIRFAQRNYSVTEGDSGQNYLSIRIVLSEAATTAVSVKVDTILHAGASDGLDFLGAHRWITLDAGQTAKTFRIPILGDTVNEAYETFAIRLSQASGAAQLDVDTNNHYAYVGIADNDPASFAPPLPNSDWLL